MIRIFPLFALFIILLPQHSLSQKYGTKMESNVLKQLEYDWLMAEFKLDTATISKMMDSTFISINGSGISNKQQELDGMYTNISRRLKDGHVVDSLRLEDVHINFYEGIAIVTFISVTKGKIKKTPFTDRRTRFYDVWIKRDGKWKAVSSQVTPLQPKATQ